MANMHSITLHMPVFRSPPQKFECQQRKCSQVNVVSSNIRVMQIFAGVQEIWGIKQERGRLRCRFSYFSLAIFSESSSPRMISLHNAVEHSP